MHDETKSALLKIVCAWAGVAYGWLTLQHIATGAALMYTLLQIYVLWRDKLHKGD